MNVAAPTVAQVFAAYLSDRKRSLSKDKLRKHETIIELFEGCLDNYAYQSLGRSEKAFWEKRWEADEETGSFCRTFGPDKILQEVGQFLDWYVIRKVMGPQWIVKSAGPVIRDLVAWLVEKDHAAQEDAADAMEKAADSARDLPRMEKLTSILYDLTERDVHGKVLEDLDLVDDMVTISKVEPGRLWFQGFDGEEIGPLEVPVESSKIAKVGWEVSATHFVRTAKGWHLVEIGNVYPY